MLQGNEQRVCILEHAFVQFVIWKWELGKSVKKKDECSGNDIIYIKKYMW